MSNESGSGQHSAVVPSVPSPSSPSGAHQGGAHQGGAYEGLRREALLPTERNRGLGTIAVVCTMAGVASGLALATTLMAMQVADSMGGPHHRCPYRAEQGAEQGAAQGAAQVRMAPDAEHHGYLGVEYVFANGSIVVGGTRPGSPARAVGLASGDQVIAVNGDRVDSEAEMHTVIYSQRPGARPVLLVQRDGATWTVQPTLAPASTAR